MKTFVQEHYRLYIGAFGLIAMAVFLFIGYRKIDQDELLLSNADYLYYSYGQEIAGEITDDTVEWFQKKQEELNRRYPRNRVIGEREGQVSVKIISEEAPGIRGVRQAAVSLEDVYMYLYP